VDLKYFLLRFLDLTIHQEVPKLFSQQELRGVVDKTTAEQSKVQQFETDPRQELGFGKFSVKIP
jgi:Mg2+/Co2+ transporter CorB